MVKIWDKNTNGSKFTNLFELRRSRGGLDCNRRDKEYIEATRKKYFPLVPSPNFTTIYKRKDNNVSTDNKLTDVKKDVGKLSPFFLLINFLLFLTTSY